MGQFSPVQTVFLLANRPPLLLYVCDNQDCLLHTEITLHQQVNAP